MESVENLERAHTSGKVRTAGGVCAVGGAGWLVNGILSLVISQPVGTAFVIAEVFWLVIQSLLLIGVVGLALSGAAPGWFGGISLGIALLGRADFVAAGGHSLIIRDGLGLLPLGGLGTAGGGA